MDSKEFEMKAMELENKIKEGISKGIGNRELLKLQEELNRLKESSNKTHKEYFGQIIDHSESFALNVKVLNRALIRNTEYPTKISFELFPVSDPRNIRSLRLSSVMKVENLFETMFKAFGYFLCDTDYFNPLKTNIRFEDYEKTLNEWWMIFSPKMRNSMLDGIKTFCEKK